MPQTQLQIDDGTGNITAVQLQCATCETEPYLDRGEKMVTQTVAGDMWEYPFTCPLCKKVVFVRVPNVGTV